MLFGASPADGKLARVAGYTIGDRGAQGWIWERDVR
jgi:hypothetical protein